jgi:hypothetical protein
MTPLANEPIANPTSIGAEHLGLVLRFIGQHILSVRMCPISGDSGAPELHARPGARFISSPEKTSYSQALLSIHAYPGLVGMLKWDGQTVVDTFSASRLEVNREKNFSQLIRKPTCDTRVPKN